MRMDWQEALADEHMQDEDKFNEIFDNYMANECDPRDTDNIFSAISDECLGDDETLKLIAECIDNRNETLLGKLVAERIVSYWEAKARDLAEQAMASGDY